MNPIAAAVSLCVCLLSITLLTNITVAGPDRELVFRDAFGEPVAIMTQEEYDAYDGVRNTKTLEPADGSALARITRPGKMIVRTSQEPVIVHQLNNHGELLDRPGDNGLVAHVTLSDEDGFVYLNGERLPATVAIQDGILKNPGPEAVDIMIISGKWAVTQTLDPGEGMVVNTDQDLIQHGAGAGSTTRTYCECDCDLPNQDHHDEFQMDCPGCITEPNDACCCYKSVGNTCRRNRVDGVVDN